MIKDRIAYELSFTVSERIDRAKDALALWMARRVIPGRLAKWIIVHRHGVVTLNRHPDEVKAFDLVKGL